MRLSEARSLDDIINSGRLAALRHAEGEATDLAFLALDEVALAERLAQIRDAIPELGPMVRTVSPPRGDRLRSRWAS